MKKHVAGVWGVVVLLVAASAVSVRATDVTGTWTFAVNLGIGSGEPTFVFEQDGETLTGTYEGTFGSANVMGEVKGDIIEFSFAAERVGKAARPPTTYTGKIMGDTMQTTVGTLRAPGKPRRKVDRASNMRPRLRTDR